MKTMRHQPFTTRREFLQRSALGFGSLALSGLFSQQNAQAAALNGLPHFAPKAKRVIFMFMAGGPSHMDLFDEKPELVKYDNKPIPPELVSINLRNGKMKVGPKTLGVGTVGQFKQWGQSGLGISTMLPHMAALADDLCLVRSMHADNQSHPTAVQQWHTGSSVLPRPSMGAWINYGLGSENENLPGFVVVTPPMDSSLNCGNIFLPTKHRGIVLRDPSSPTSEKIRYLGTTGQDREQQKRQLSLVEKLNRQHLGDVGGKDQMIEGMISSFEMAFRMQMEAPEVLDLSKETPETLALYGIGEDPTDAFGRQCLLARRLCESGVRFVQVSAPDNSWDHHTDIHKKLPESCLAADKPTAGLLIDLKRRGLLKDTLVIWGGEFGRTPCSESYGFGRNHNPYAFTTVLAGGGIKGGLAYGTTDISGSESIENRVHIHDLHATILHQLGINHEKLTYRFQGRDFRLTDVSGHVVQDILA